MGFRKKRKVHYKLGKFILDINEGNLFYEKGYGEKIDKNLILSIYEIYFLFKKKWASVIFKENELSENELLKIINKKEKNFLRNYLVYENLKSSGYVIKTGLKYGCEFRVYDKGTRPGIAHSKWLLEIFSDKDKLKTKDFVSVSRIANSTKKNMLIAIVDDDNKVSYYESSWIKP